MARRLFLGCVLLLCGVVASCGDSTAPEGRFLIVVSPDTVHATYGQAPYIRYSERFVSVDPTKLWIASLELENEATPGEWRTLVDPNNLYLQAALGDAWVPATSDGIAGERSLLAPLGPGRYRLRQRFRVTAPSAMQSTGDVSVATSNPFVVVTP